MVFDIEDRRRARYAQAPEAAAVTAALAADAKAHPILLGLTTGVLVWATTRVLDRIFFGGKR